ncbi:MAG: hypothetical protein EXR62_18470 [Chloroflexi bacterium]|nr:hypothetical protein [Chloroflexota bacterium]
MEPVEKSRLVSAFTGQFYTRLPDHGFVDLAVNVAHAQIRDQRDWGMPVLFSRLPDNQILTLRPNEVADCANMV